MEEHNFTRLLSEESTHSTLSLESCDYHQLEIFDQLPSIQACKPQQNRESFYEVCETYLSSVQASETHSDGHLFRGPRDKSSTQPLRNLAMCIHAKRGARDRRKMEKRNIGCWESWRRSQSINRKRVWAHIVGILSSMLPWQHTLRTVEARFGVGVKAYFVFIRYLIFVNLLLCALIWGFILGPTIFFGRGSNETLTFGGNDSVLDFFEGSGYLDRSPVFFGFYTRGSLDFQCLNTPLLYFTGILTILILSVIMVVRKTMVGYKHTWILEKRYSMNVSYKIFSGWDFTIQDPAAADLKHGFISNDLKLFLEEQSFSRRAAQRTFGQRVRLYLLRFILNLLVVSMLGGAFFLIFYATRSSQDNKPYHWLVSLLVQYSAPIAITFVNTFLPHVFCKISSFEDYSFTTQVNVTLVRSVFLRLSALGIYLVFLFRATRDKECRENRFGREMYKMCIFDFISTFCCAFFFIYPRKLVQEKWPTSVIARILGRQSFLIPFNVLDLVESQTVTWVGVYYCPLLPVIGILKLVATLYIEKFTVLRCCVAKNRMFRASSSSVLFHFMLLLALLIATTTLGFDIYQQVDPAIIIQSSCGPFRNGETVFNVTGTCVDSLPKLAQSTLHYLTSEAFAIPLILAEIIILTSFVSRGRANQKAIERLKDILVMSCSDKRFLVKQHATVLRHKKDKHRVRPVATRDDVPQSPLKDPPSTHMN